MSVSFTYPGQKPTVQFSAWSHHGWEIFLNRVAMEMRIYNIRSMEGLGGTKKWAMPDREPLVLLFTKLEAEEQLTPEECALLSPRLRKITGMWNHNDIDQVMAFRLANYMDECVKLNVSLTVFR